MTGDLSHCARCGVPLTFGDTVVLLRAGKMRHADCQPGKREKRMTTVVAREIRERRQRQTTRAVKS
jgi:hypothetical protein